MKTSFWEYFPCGDKRLKKQNLCFLCVVIAASVFLFWKAQYGYIFSDEPFMISLGHRLSKGDMLFVNEWHPSQLTGLFFFPFVKIYDVIHGNIEGLIIFLRFIYVILWLSGTIILYQRIKNYGWISIPAVLVFTFFTPLDQMTLSYNAVALWSMLIFSSYFLIEGNPVKDYIHGVVLAAAVVAQPLMIIPYLIWAFSVIFLRVKKGKRSTVHLRILRFDCFVRMSTSAVFLATLFFFYIFIFESNPEKLLESINVIFGQTVSRQGDALLDIVNSAQWYFNYPTIAGAIVLVASLADKGRDKRKLLYLIIQILIFSFEMTTIYFWGYAHGLFNLIMSPINMLGFQAFILTHNKDWTLFSSMSVCGVILATISILSSDTGFLAFSSGIVVSSVASILIIYKLYTELKSHGKLKGILYNSIAAVLILVIAVQLGCQVAIRIQRNYWDDTTANLNYKITSGAAKGIITTEELGKNYENIYEDIQTIKSKTESGEKLLVLSMFPAVYLDYDGSYATYSAWIYKGKIPNADISNERLKQYYSINPDKYPDCIYILYSNIEDLPQYDSIDFSKYDSIELKKGIAFIRNCN